jgi:hypothetical protein
MLQLVWRPVLACFIKRNEEANKSRSIRNFGERTGFRDKAEGASLQMNRMGFLIRGHTEYFKESSSDETKPSCQRHMN